MPHTRTPPFRSRPQGKWIALIAYMALLATLSHQSSLPVDTMWFAHADKLQHLVAYGVLGILAWRALPGSPGKRCFAALALAWLFGMSDELHQMAVVGRDASPWDWLADAFGASLGVGAGLFWRVPKKVAGGAKDPEDTAR
jgi:VanZ family protein